MQDAIKPLLDSELLSEEAQQEITEAWETKLNEAREQVRVELREEFAQRYEHDKQVMVEALDRMVQKVSPQKSKQCKLKSKHWPKTASDSKPGSKKMLLSSTTS